MRPEGWYVVGYIKLVCCKLHNIALNYTNEKVIVISCIHMTVISTAYNQSLWPYPIYN